MGMKLFAADVERIARWAHGSRQGKPITAHTIGTWIKKDELKATKAANTEWKRQTHRTNERGQVEVADTSPWEIDLDDLERHPKIAIDRQQLAELEAERKRGDPGETARRVAVTEERMAAMELRISELEQERADLATENVSLKGRVATLEAQMDGILTRLDAPVVSPVKRLNEDAFRNAPVTRHDDLQAASYVEPLHQIPFVPVPAQRVRAAAPLYDTVMAEKPVVRSQAQKSGGNDPDLPDGWEPLPYYGVETLGWWSVTGLGDAITRGGIECEQGKWRWGPNHRLRCFWALTPEQKERFPRPDPTKQRYK